MNALARFRRSAVTRVTVSWSGILLLCLSSCASRLPFFPTPGPPPNPTPNPFPQETLQTSWDLDYVLVNGEKLPPYYEGQCLSIGYKPETYYFNDGCNVGYCDLQENPPPNSKGDRTVICSITVVGCMEDAYDPNGQREFVKWDKPFHEAVMSYSHVELRDGALWLSTRAGGERTLVFRPREEKCR